MKNSLNLSDYGAKCDGTTDDTTAIQAWANAAAANMNLTAPAGICLFSSPISFPHTSYYSVPGEVRKTQCSCTPVQTRPTHYLPSMLLEAA